MKRFRIVWITSLMMAAIMLCAAPLSASGDLNSPELSADLSLNWIPPIITIVPTIRVSIPPIHTPTLIPIKTPVPTATPETKTTPKPTKKPTKKTPKTTSPVPVQSGQVLTSEGPLFLSFRNDLTQEFWMFTPMDLSLNAEYAFPLIAAASRVVGEARVTVESGMVIVSYLLVNGVTVNREAEFYTFFKDIGSVTTVDPLRLQNVKMAFNIPYHIASRLNSDSKVLLYINMPLSYDPTLPGLKSFSFQDQGYIQRVAELYPLMD